MTRTEALDVFKKRFSVTPSAVGRLNGYAITSIAFIIIVPCRIASSMSGSDCGAILFAYIVFAGFIVAAIMIYPCSIYWDQTTHQLESIKSIENLDSLNACTDSYTYVDKDQLLLLALRNLYWIRCVLYLLMVSEGLTALCVLGILFHILCSGNCFGRSCADNIKRNLGESCKEFGDYISVIKIFL